MKTFSQSQKAVSRQWYLLDAAEAPLGRVATRAASLLIGKGKPTISPNIDAGDFVVIINAAQVGITGDKLAKKMYYRHSGFPGGLRTKSLNELMTQDPTQVIALAVKGMLPVNKLKPGRLARLKVYADGTHQHEAQSPLKLAVKVELK